MSQRRTVLITGCSEGGLGDALARALHQHGQRVIATARNPDKMAHFQDLGIEALTLDVLSSSSISACVEAVKGKTGGSLDMLINNSGHGYAAPLMDADLDAARQLFDVNVWAVLEVTQAFIPLLMKSDFKPTIVNNTSIGSVVTMPLSGIYHASKAAAAMITDTMRLELSPFKIRVIDLKTGVVDSAFTKNRIGGSVPLLPENSIYSVARAEVEEAMRCREIESNSVDRDKWAQQVVSGLLAKSPPLRIWKGGYAFLAWVLATFLPLTFNDGTLLKMAGLTAVKEKLAKRAESKTN